MEALLLTLTLTIHYPVDNGFTFKTYNAHDMFDACMRAKAAYEDKRGWNRIIKRDMAEDFSWANSAELYIKLYHELTDK